jgi:hypothetical protein
MTEPSAPGFRPKRADDLPGNRATQICFLFIMCAMPKSETQRTRSAHVVVRLGQEDRDISVPKVVSGDIEAVVDENQRLRERVQQLEDLLGAILLFP